MFSCSGRTRQCLAVAADSSFSGLQVACELIGSPARAAKPKKVVSDNGSELTSNAILLWANDSRVAWHYISPRTSRSIPRQAVCRQAHWRSGGHNAPEAPLARSITFASIAPFASIVDPRTVTGAPTLRWAPMR